MSLLKKPKAPPPMPKSQKLLRMRKLPGKRKNVEQEKMAKKATKLAFETLSSWMQRLRRKP